jgi:SAM-dependent methyltransferase
MLPRTEQPIVALRERLQALADRLRRRPYPGWYAADNFFPSRFRMDRAQAPIVAVVRDTLAGRGGPVLDLGCGNGVLLKKIRDANPVVVPFGIDRAPTAIEHARLVLPPYAEHFVAGDMFEDDRPWSTNRRYALVLLAPTRFLETTAERGAVLRDRLARCCDTLIVYAYGKSLARHGSLAGLCAATGLRLRPGGRPTVACWRS